MLSLPRLSKCSVRRTLPSLLRSVSTVAQPDVVDRRQGVNASIPRRKVSLHTALKTPIGFASYDTIDCEALVVGCGVAGSAAALRMANQGIKVTMISAADDPYDCATYHAQGGIIYKGLDDSPALLSSDVHRAGAGVCDDPAVQKLAVDGPSRVEEILLDTVHVPFQRTPEGQLARTLEASHNRPRILYKADHTGRTIDESLVAGVREHQGIHLLSGHSAFDLVKNDQGACVGVLSVSNTGKVEHYRAPFTLLASGGIGDIYKNTSNPESARGEGIAMAARAGAKLKNMEFVQFHPTTLMIPNERRFLLTEALRGEGGILKDKSGRPFAKDYHPDGELAPRDVVARMILSEMAKQGESNMYLDISYKESEWIKKRFPTIYEHCMERGIDMTKEGMPVVPSAHYHCGGVQVDLRGRTTVPNLYAAGEVSCTGLHGANRLASTSLLEGLVWGCASADDFMLKENFRTIESMGGGINERDPFEGLHGVRLATKKELDEIMSVVQETMWEDIGPLRTVSGMKRGVEKLSEMEVQAEKLFHDCVVTRETAAVRNAVRSAKEIAYGALHAPRSVGTHFVKKE